MNQQPHEKDPEQVISIGTYRNKVRMATLYVETPFIFESGFEMSGIQVAYETWGKLDKNGSNAILLVHALTGDSHAASHGPDDCEGWFEGMVGKGRAFDPEKHYIVCANWLGSNYGTTGPVSIDPATGRPFGTSFPRVSIPDMARVLKALSDHLGIKSWHTAAGGSVGGLIILDLAARFPALLDSAIPIATSLRSSPWVIAFHAIMRRILLLGRDSSDEELQRRSLEAARMVGMVTYRSRQEFVKKFRRIRAELHWQEKGCLFAVESYLQHQGIKLDQRFDPTTYEYLTVAADNFDLGETHGSVEIAMSRIRCPVLAVGIDSDYLFPLEEQEEIVSELKKAGGNAQMGVITSDFGHDGFLIEFDQLNSLVGEFLGRLPL
jgi:homoserine O-acetyltransferase